MKSITKGICRWLYIFILIFLICMVNIDPFRRFVIGRIETSFWNIERALGINLENSEEKEYSKVDKNNNIYDAIGLVKGARKEVKNKTKYKSNYYDGGYPPKKEGVCTDVIWRAFENIDINLKELIDKDIKDNTELYSRVNGKQDPNIDFRRVPNQLVFFQRYAESITTEINWEDEEILNQWQPGDIVISLEPYEHVAIISDKSDSKGIPYIIHNTPPRAPECPFIFNEGEIVGHFRWKY
ncbi:DUF1287 domain-containing protein [Clostridium sp. UBA1056]|uniref:DUF1287 domain-containing protein n=1 Tax=unclassified Clostridium TaxID=2614128 RepID=UPI0032170F73